MGDYGRNSLLITFGGGLPGGEAWSCGLRATAATGTDAASDALVADVDVDQLLADNNASVRHDIVQWWSDPQMFLPQDVTLGWVKINKIGRNGRYLEDQTHEAVFPALGGTSLSNARYPNQVALAVTLETGYQRGPAHQGRIYLPRPAVPLGSDGRISAGDAVQIAGRTNLLINNINAHLPGAGLDGIVVCVMSRLTGRQAQRAVTHTSVGRVFDTIRRRRNGLLEDHRVFA
jgi:hypothetical protein